MKQSVQFLFSSLIVVACLFSFNVLNTHAEEVISNFEGEAVFKELSPEEIYVKIALARGISVEEAKKSLLEEAQEEYLKQNSSVQMMRVSESVLEKLVAEGRRQLEGSGYLVNDSSGTGAWAQLRYGVVVKVAQSGSYVWVTAVESGTEYVLATGTGSHVYTSGYKSAVIDSGRVHFMSTGEVESVIPKSFGTSFSSRGFTLAGNSGSNQIWRKSVNINTYLTPGH